MIAGGVEQMSRAPLVMAKPTEAFQRGNQTIYDTTLGWRFVEPEDGGGARHARDGRDRREGRRALQRVARGAGQVRARLAAARRQGARARAAWRSRLTPITTGTDKKTGAAITGRRRRAPAPRDHDRAAREAQARVHEGRRHGHRRQRVGPQRRRRGAPVASEQAVKELGPDPEGALRHRRDRRRRAELHGPRPDPGEQEGARARGPDGATVSISQSSTKPSRRRQSLASTRSGSIPRR